MTSFPPFVRHALDAEPIRADGLGLEISVLIPAAATGGALCMFEEITKAGGGPPLHVHEHQVECFYFQEGSYRLHVDGQEWQVGPGDVAVVPPGVAHSFANIGTTTGRLMFSLSPALDGEAFFHAFVAAIKDGGPPDVARLNEQFAPMGFRIVGPPLLGTPLSRTPG